MKRVSMLALAVVAAVGFARSASADDEVVRVEATHVAYVLDLGKMSGDKSEALVALLRREFPDATVKLVDGSLMVQTDGATFKAVQKVLESQGVGGTSAWDRKNGEPKLDVQIKAIREHLLRLGKEMGKVEEARGEPTKIKVKVGDLCEGCADCLAGALSKEFPALKFFPDEADVVVLADPAGQAAVQAWLSDLRRGAKGQEGHHRTVWITRDALTHNDGVIVLEGEEGKEAHDGRKKALPGGRERPRPPLGAEDLKEFRRRIEGFRDGREGMHADRGEDFGALRERFEALRARLEGARDRRPAKPPGVARPQDPRKKDAPQGPMAEWRQRIQHLQQAAEHLKAAGWEGLAKQAAEAVETTKRQAEEAAEKLRAAEEAQRAERQKAERAHSEEAVVRELKKARVEAGHEREGGDELTTLIRRLHQQVEELRKEVRELREKVGGERRDAR